MSKAPLKFKMTDRTFVNFMLLCDLFLKLFKCQFLLLLVLKKMGLVIYKVNLLKISKLSTILES